MGAHDHSGSAVSALQAVLLPEPLLDGVELVACREALHRRDGMTIRLNGEHGARFHGFAVQQDGTGAADGSFAADVGTGQASGFAQKMYQEEAWFDVGAVLNSINLDGDVFFHTYPVVAGWFS